MQHFKRYSFYDTESHRCKRMCKCYAYQLNSMHHRGVARILGKGALKYARKNLSHAHLLTVKVEVQIVKENEF